MTTEAYIQHLKEEIIRQERIPWDEESARLDLSANSLKVLAKRYLRRDLEGNIVETPAEMFRRVAYHIALPDKEWGGDVEATTRKFYEMLTKFRFMPNSPTFTGAGTPLGQLAACFVIPISDDMGKEPDGIFMTLRNAALIQQTGGGNGFSFSRLRPKGDRVSTSAGVATGPVGFMKVYDMAFDVISQGGVRRGANMAVLRVDHPDVLEFVRSKEKEGELTNFNISVALTDEFMRAVEEDREFDLVNPRDGKVWKTVRARDLFDEIVRHAHHNGEPGALFIDTANRSNPLPHLYELEATNPCFVGDTRIATNKGWIPIRELAESGEPFEVLTDNRAPWSGRGHPRPELGTALRPAVKAWKTRTSVPVLRLRTRMGYTVVATPDHRFLTPDQGYVELQDLKPGDTVLLQSGEGAWSEDYRLPNVERLAETMAGMALAGDHASGQVCQRQDFVAQYAGVPREWSQDLGLVLGWLVGDGWLSPSSKSPVGMVFRSPEMLSRVHTILRGWFGEGHVADRGSHYQVTYGRLPYEFFTSLGVLPVKATEKRVPESIWRAPREAVIGFLQGLFSADGSVQINEHKRDCTVRLASSSRQLLEDVQLLLLNFGIVSRIYKRRDAKETLMPDGHGGLKAYSTATQYELVIGKANRDRFATLIGLADPDKQARLMRYVESQVRGPYREMFEDVVESVEEAGTADVYDLVEPETHSLIANGLVCHNCGEQWLGPYENCCLGSINLAKHVKEVDGKRVVDWDLLQETVENAVHFLDNVVTANKYVPAVPQLKEAAHRARRIGLGIMGLADMMYDLGIRYGSEEAREFAAQVMEFVRYHAMRKSIELAEERGPFPAIKGSIYDPEDLKWRPPEWPEWLGGGPKTDWGRPSLDWEAIVDGIKKHGIRNAAQTTVAPTGTIATVSGCEGYGCEPVFALAYIRHFKDEDRDVELEYVSPRFMRALDEAQLDEAAKRRIIDEVLRKGTCQHIEELPDPIRHTFVVAQDISAEEHVYMQASLQVFVDNSISKTINFHEHATVDDVKTAYFLAWRLGCKGITVYVTGTRKEVVLETRETKEKKEGGVMAPATIKAEAAVAPPPWNGGRQLRPRPTVLHGKTYRRPTPVGTAWITVNSDENGEPFEVFLNVGKAGSDVAADSEALGRLISLILRLPSPLSPRERLQEVIHQLSGIGGGRSMGFGPERVRSLPDAIAQVLRHYLEQQAEGEAEPVGTQLPLSFSLPNGEGEGVHRTEYGDICPECGQATFIPHEGCKRCTNCGYSEC